MEPEAGPGYIEVRPTMTITNPLGETHEIDYVFITNQSGVIIAQTTDDDIMPDDWIRRYRLQYIWGRTNLTINVWWKLPEVVKKGWVWFVWRLPLRIIPK